VGSYSIGLVHGMGGSAGIGVLIVATVSSTTLAVASLILLAVFLFLLGFSFVLMGLLAELIIRTYHESQAKPIYWVRHVHNVDAEERTLP